MDRDVILDLHKRAVSQGYRKGVQDFISLLNSDNEVFEDMYGYVVEKGYPKTKEDFAILIGVENIPVKKKVTSDSLTDSASVLEDGSLDSPTAEVSKESITETLGTPDQQPLVNPSDRLQPRDMGGLGAELSQTPTGEIKTTEAVVSETLDLQKKQDEQYLQSQQKEESSLGFQSPELQHDILTIDDKLISQKEDDVVNYLTDKFSKYGFIFDTAGWLGNKVIARTSNGLQEITVDVNNTNVENSDALQKFITLHATSPEDRHIEDSVSKAIRAQKLRTGARDNGDGSVSSHNMVYTEVDGEHLVFPTLFPVDVDVQTSNPKRWMELDLEEALMEARTRGEVFEFETSEEAQKFADGSWETVGSPELIGSKIYQDKGYDYFLEQEMFETYEQARDAVDFLENAKSDGRTYNDLTAEEQELYKEYFSNNRLVPDVDKKITQLKKQEENLFEEVFTQEKQELRENLDKALQDEVNNRVKTAVKENQVASLEEDRLQTLSLNEFGVRAEDINTIQPKTQREADMINDIKVNMATIQTTKDLAADKYDIAKTYFSAKNDKHINTNFLTGLNAFRSTIKTGVKRGNASELLMAMQLGIIDSNDKEVAKKIAEYMGGADPRQSRFLYRYMKSKGFKEGIDAMTGGGGVLSLLTPAGLSKFLANGVNLAANSFSMMLPYGIKIIPTTVSIGAGTGGAIGSTAMGVGAVPGAIAGGARGLYTGMAASGFIMEYTNSIFDVMSEKGYDLTDPEDVLKAVNDETVWKEGSDRGLKRGIPIAIVDYLSMSMAGKVFKTGSIASTGKKVVAQIGERMVFDPAAEGLGELSAQLIAGQKIDAKEIVLESWGGIGNNTSAMALNLYMESRNFTNTQLANNLIDFDFIANEVSSDERISNWSTNMSKLGKISEEQNEEIQKNVGYRRETRELLGEKTPKPLQARVMELLSARDDLSRTSNLKLLNKEIIKQINDEIVSINLNKKLVENPIDLRAVRDVKTKKRSAYLVNNKQVDKKQFIRIVNRFTDDELKNALLDGTIQYTNDAEVETLIKNKQDAVQKRSTEKVDVQEQARDGETVGTRDTIEEVTPEGQVESEQTSEVIEEVPQPLKATKQDKIDFKEGNLDETRLSGLLSEIATKNLDKRQLTPFQKTLSEQYGEEVAQIQNDIQGIRDLEEFLGDTQGKKVQFRREDRPEKRREQTLLRQRVFESEEFKLWLEEKDKPFDANEFYEQQRKELGDDFAAAEATQKEVERREKLREKLQTPRIKTPTSPALDLGYKLGMNKKGFFPPDSNLSYLNKQFEPLGYKTRKARVNEMGRGGGVYLVDIKTGKPFFPPKTQYKTEEGVDTTVDETLIIDEMNRLPSGNTDVTLVEEVDVKTNVDELSTRTDTGVDAVLLEVIDGVPVIFNITDQLTTGNVINPNTGNEIKNLKGGIGFTGTRGNKNLAWASVDERSALNKIRAASKVYKENKELFEQWWKDNPQYKGLVPMNVVSMGEKSILSNEAVFRVLRDNMQSLPLENRKNALNVLKRSINDRIKVRRKKMKGKKVTELTKKNYYKEISALQNVLDLIEENNIIKIDDLISPNIISKMSLPNRSILLEQVSYGVPNMPGETKSIGPVGKTNKTALALLKGQPAENNKLINLSSVVDIITEPQLKDVPQRSIVAIQGVDVLNPQVVKANHPNYKYGIKGKSIGVLENPVPLGQVYKEVYQAAVKRLTTEDIKQQVISDKAALREKKEKGTLKTVSVGKLLTEAVGVQTGLTQGQFQGIISEGDVDNTMKLIAFMNEAFPGVNVSATQEAFNTVMESEDVRSYSRGNDVIYGVTVDGDIWINPEVHNSESALFNTAIHEFGHVWTNYLQTTKKGKEIYNKGVELVKQTTTYKQQLKKFDGNEKEAADEAIAILIGNKGETIANASLKSKFKEWLLGVWRYIKSKFKLSKDLSPDEIQNLTLDEFLGTALADIFSGREIKLTDKQLLKLKNPEVMFKASDGIIDIINKGRQQGISDASIKSVLINRGFKRGEITEAMSIQIQEDVKLPAEFTDIKGGAIEGLRMFNEIRKNLNDFGYKRGKKEPTQIETYASMRAKAQELLKEHSTYKKQDETTQLALQSALDRSLGIRTNARISKEISLIRQRLKDKKSGAKDLRTLQQQLKSIIRKVLPQSPNYSQAQINRLIQSVTDLTKDNFVQKTERVIKVVNQQRQKIKRELIDEIGNLVKQKAKTKKTASGKVRSAGLDAQGQAFFKELNKILKIALITDTAKRQDAMIELVDSLSPENIEKFLNGVTEQELISKAVKNEALTVKEQAILDRLTALDEFGDIINMDLEQVQQKLNQLRDMRGASIARLKAARMERALIEEKLSEEAKQQIEAVYPELFTTRDGFYAEVFKKEKGSKGYIIFAETAEELDKTIAKYPKTTTVDYLGEVKEGVWVDGVNKGKKLDIKSVKDVNELRQDENKIRDAFNKLKLIEGLKRWFDSLKFGSTTGLRDYVRNRLLHLGSLMELMDRTTQGKRFFTDNVYRPLRRMNETFRRGEFNLQKKLDEIANSIPGITRGYKQIRSKLHKGTVDMVIKGKKEIYNPDQLLRIYALSKNEIQRKKLEKQGFTPEKIEEIKRILGKPVIEFADKMVDFLSNEYFESVNDIYRSVNNVNLNYVSDYFPTKTIAQKPTPADLLEQGDFSAVFNTETAPALKDRSDITGKVELLDSFTDTLHNHIQTMEKYKAYAQGVKNLSAIINTPAVQVLLDASRLGFAVKRAINFAINPQSISRVKENFFTKALTRFTSYALSLKIMQIPKQASSFINAFEDYRVLRSKARGDKKNLERIKDHFLTVPEIILFLGDMSFVMATLPWQITKAMKMSATFRDRMVKGLEGDVYGLEAGSPTYRKISKQDSARGRSLRFIRMAMASPTILGDIMGVMGYMANYYANRRAGMSKEKALEIFNEYELTQQTRSGTEKIPLQMSPDEATRSFTMFGSTLFLQINKAYIAMTNITRDVSRGKVPLTKDVRSLILNYALANVAFVFAANSFKYIKGEEGDKEEVLQRMRDAMAGLNLIYQIPLLGAAVETAVNYSRGNRRKGDTAINPFTDITQRMMRAEDPIDFALPMVEWGFGLQIQPFIGINNSWKDGDISEEDWYDMLGVSTSYRPEHAKKKKKKKSTKPKRGGY